MFNYACLQIFFYKENTLIFFRFFKRKFNTFYIYGLLIGRKALSVNEVSETKMMESYKTKSKFIIEWQTNLFF